MKIEKSLRFPLGLAGVVSVLCGSLAWAQVSSPNVGTKAEPGYTIPVSDKILTFEVRLPSGNVAKLLVREGEMAKVGSLGEGYGFGLVPIVKDLDKKVVAFNIFRLTQDEKGNELARQIRQVEASLEASISTDTEPNLQIRLISIEEPRSSVAERGYTIPISDKILTFEVSLPSGKLVKLLVREGEMAKVGSLGKGYAFGLVPIVKDIDKKVVAFNIFRLTQDEKGNELARQIRQVEASLEASISTDTEPSLQIRLISIEEPRSSLAPGNDRACAMAAYAEARREDLLRPLPRRNLRLRPLCLDV